MYLAAIADAQPQAPAVPSQMPPHAAMQAGGTYMQHPQLGAGQQSMFMPKVPMQFNPQQMQEQHLQHQHPSVMQAHMGMRPGPNNGVHALHAEGVVNSPSDGRGNKPGGPLSEPGSADGGRGNSAAGPGGVNGETSEGAN